MGYDAMLSTPAGKAQKAYRRLRDAIVKGRLAPGAYLSERDLAAHLGISRTPIRQALHRLEKDGYVRLVPRVGARINQVSARDLLDLLEMRQYLEPQAARSAAHGITAAAERELQAVRQVFAAEGMGPSTARGVDRLIAADHRLHRLVLRLAGNRRVRQVLTGLAEMIQRYRYAGMPLRFARNTAEHLAIVDALLARDGLGAEVAMARHLQAFVDDVQQRYRRPGRARAYPDSRATRPPSTP